MNLSVPGLGRLSNSDAAIRDAGGDVGAGSQTQDAYVNLVFQALAVFRFFSFAMGAGLAFALNLGDDAPIGQVSFVVVVGLYNTFRVLWRFNRTGHSGVVGWLLLVSDVGLSVLLVVMTDGLDSAFLIYSLSPILTAGLLMDVRSAMVVAVISGLSITGGYVAAGLGIGTFQWILNGNYLAFAVMYFAVCLLIGYLPFLANLNWQRRVRSDLIAAERQRLRREVHDNVAQTLAFLSLKVKRAEERATSPSAVMTARDVMDIGSTVERAYLAVRDYLDELQEDSIGEPLSTSLALAVGQWSRDTGLPAQMSLADTDDTLSSRVKQQLIQISREALANVAKHSYAERVWVELQQEPDGVTLRIKDDGRGFSDSQPRGHGLDIMHERSAVIGAALSVHSEPGEGTEVIVVYPTEPGETA